MAGVPIPGTLRARAPLGRGPTARAVWARVVVPCALAASACGDSAPTRDGGTAGGTATATAPPAPAPWFREEARARGLVFDHHSGATPEYWMPEIPCAGAALFDMDGDGDLDAYLVESDGVFRPREERRGNRLFRNLGDGRFEDATAGSGADDRGFGMGVACGDADGDGDTDLYVTNLDGNALLLNDGAGVFRDGTAAAGVGCGAWSSSAAFLDYDLDGDLDLYVACYVRWTRDAERRCDGLRGGRDYCAPAAYAAPAPDRLFRNEGGGRFTDVSEAAGLRAAFGNGLGVVTGDFDGDGRPDVFVANDGTENQLWLQTEPGRFRDAALAWGCATDRDGARKAGMGAVAADADDDGDLDVWVVNLVSEGDSYFVNEGGRFADRAPSAGLASASKPYTRFGIGLADFDLDGRLDAYVANGRVTRAPTPVAADPYAEPNQVLRGLEGGRFEEVLPVGGTAAPVVASSRGAAFGDVDGDGDVDVLVTNRDGPAHLFVCVAPRRGGWASIQVVDRTGADALGATVTARLGARTLTRDVRAAYSYCSSNDPRIHVGLGGAAALEGVRVRWTGGSLEAFGDLAGGRAHVLRRGGGTAVAAAKEESR